MRACVRSCICTPIYTLSLHTHNAHSSSIHTHCDTGGGRSNSSKLGGPTAGPSHRPPVIAGGGGGGGGGGNGATQRNAVNEVDAQHDRARRRRRDRRERTRARARWRERTRAARAFSLSYPSSSARARSLSTIPLPPPARARTREVLPHVHAWGCPSPTHRLPEEHIRRPGNASISECAGKCNLLRRKLKSYHRVDEVLCFPKLR